MNIIPDKNIALKGLVIKSLKRKCLMLKLEIQYIKIGDKGYE